MRLKPVRNACCCHLHSERCITLSWRWDLVYRCVAGLSGGVLCSAPLGMFTSAHSAAADEYCGSCSESVGERTLLHCPLMASGGTSKIDCQSSAEIISVRAEWLHQRGRAPSEHSETLQWQITPHPASMPRVALPIALLSLLRYFFSLCWTSNLNKHWGCCQL
jgi:hypothetical protein